MKYKVTDETMEYCGRTLYRIERIEDGLKGGWVESVDNLSQDGTCFIYNNAKAYESAKVYGNAEVWGNAEVHGNVKVVDTAMVFGNAKVFGNARVWGNAKVFGNTKVFGLAEVFGDAEVHGNVKVVDNAMVFGNAKVFGNARVWGNARIYGDAKASTEVFTCNAGKDYITVTDGHIIVGCEIHTFDEWNKNVEKIGVRNNYAESDIQLYATIIRGFISKKLIK